MNCDASHLNKRFFFRNANVKDTFRNILSNVKETLNENGVDGEMANKKNLKQRVYAKKRRLEGPRPQICSYRDLHMLPEEYKKLDDEPFLVYDEEAGATGMRMLEIISQSGKKILEYSDNWCGDGTFQTAPPPFKQVYMIYGNPKSKHILPACFALLPNKDAETYLKLLNVVQALVKKKPNTFISDFEMAFTSAVRDTYMDSNIQGCFFHLKQAVLRQIQTRTLLKRFRENADFRYAVYLFFALAYVPEGFVIDVYKEILKPIFEKTLPMEPKVQEFFNYLECTYLGEAITRRRKKHGPSFPISDWNCFNQVLKNGPTTNNGAEVNIRPWLIFFLFFSN